MKFKIWLFAAMLALATVARAATNDLTGLLQKGLFEEEANRDLTAAIANYQSLASAFDKDRQLAATAIFRLGECYRKLGKTNEAVVQYQRIIKEFSDQQTLVTLSQQNLSGLRPGSAADSSSGPSLDDLHLALIHAKSLVASVDGTIAAAHGTNRSRVLIFLFLNKHDEPLQLLSDDYRSLLDRRMELLKTYLPDNSQVKDLDKQILAKQKAMDDRAEELAAAAHRSLDQAQKAYDDKLAGLNSGISPQTAESKSSSERSQQWRQQIDDATAQLARDSTLLDKLKVMNMKTLREALPGIMPDAQLDSLEMQLNQAQQDLIRLQNDYAPDHPKYKTAQEGIAAINDKIDQRISGIMIGLQTKVESTASYLQQLRARVQDTQERASAQSDATTDEEQTQIRNIQAMIQNSPDLINAPNGDGMTPLLLASEKGQLVVAKYLLDHGADVNGLSRNHGSVPLTIASGNGHKAMVELLLARGADVNGRGLNPFYEAVNRGYLGVAEVLLANKADVNLRSGTDTSGARPIHRAVMGDNVELLQLLLKHGADVNVTDAEGRTPLEFAAMQNQTNIAKVLLTSKAAIDARDNKGGTPLHEAADRGNAEMVSLLLNSGAAADPTNNNNATPLLLAVIRGRADITRVLLDHKADPNHRGRAKDPGNGGLMELQPVYRAIDKGNDDILKLLLDAGANPEGPGQSPLFFAIDHNAVEAVRLLLEHRANPNHVESGWPALSMAVGRWKDKRIIASLLDKGADPNARDADGYPPLFRTQDAEIAGQLIARKADVNARLKAGQTVLMGASWPANYGEFLLKNGANADLQDTNGNTALHFAVFRSYTPWVAILLEHKANPNLQNSQGFTPLDMAKAVGQNLGSMMGPNYGNNFLSAEAQKEIPDLLIKAGGLANLPKRDRIEVRRASESPVTINKDSPGRNRYSLLETIANTYGLISRNGSGQSRPSSGFKQVLLGGLRFPDFKQVIIYRRTDNSAKQTTIKVNVDEILNTGDCSRDLWLEWGDIVEISEVDHPVDERWDGLSQKAATALIKCVSREVIVKIKGESTTLKLSPELTVTNPGTSAEEWSLARVSYMLRSVLDNSKLVRVSSDLSRVKITRIDPATKKTTEWIVDCSDNNQPGLWLRDGDVIEVPEKQ